MKLEIKLKLNHDCQEYRGVLLPITCTLSENNKIQLLYKKVKSTYPDNLTLYSILEEDQNCDLLIYSS